MIGLIGSAVGALGSLFSGISARNQARKAEKQLEQRKADLQSEYAQEKNTDYLDTETARSTLALLRRQNKRAQEALNNNAVKSGASDEAKVAIRNIRRDANDAFKKMNKNNELTEDDQKDLEEKIQKLTDKYVKEIDKAIEEKTKEIMTV